MPHFWSIELVVDIGLAYSDLALTRVLLGTLRPSRYSKLNGSPGPQRPRAVSFAEDESSVECSS
jgi:hypothetical protein